VLKTERETDDVVDAVVELCFGLPQRELSRHDRHRLDNLVLLAVRPLSSSTLRGPGMRWLPVTLRLLFKHEREGLDDPQVVSAVLPRLREREAELGAWTFVHDIASASWGRPRWRLAAEVSPASVVSVGCATDADDGRYVVLDVDGAGVFMG